MYSTRLDMILLHWSMWWQELSSYTWYRYQTKIFFLITDVTIFLIPIKFVNYKVPWWMRWKMWHSLHIPFALAPTYIAHRVLGNTLFCPIVLCNLHVFGYLSIGKNFCCFYSYEIWFHFRTRYLLKMIIFYYNNFFFPLRWILDIYEYIFSCLGKKTIFIFTYFG